MRAEHYIDMKSPLTGGRVKLIEDTEEQEFRKEKFTVHTRYCVCEDTGEQFTLEGQDDFLLNQLYSQYRISHGIPFPDEIKEIRERYGLNYTQISKIVGFGANQWKQYEQGVVPSESNGKIIVTLRSKQCMLALLEASFSEFQPSEYEKIHMSIVSASADAEKSTDRRLFYGSTIRGLMNGYAEMNIGKLQAMVRFLIHNDGGDICPTKLNKEMFYADFLHFRRHGKSISGLRYRAIQYGPVPEHYDTIYDNIEGVRKECIVSCNNESVLLHYENNQDDSAPLNKEETDTLQAVSSLLRPMNASEAVELSHQEDAWKNHVGNHSLIPYSEAFGLKALA